jgi:hypothetical protein
VLEVIHLLLARRSDLVRVNLARIARLALPFQSIALLERTVAIRKRLNASPSLLGITHSPTHLRLLRLRVQWVRIAYLELHMLLSISALSERLETPLVLLHCLRV